MSIKTTLIVDDIEFPVLGFFFAFFQGSDYLGRPSNTPNAHPFTFTIEASKHITFIEWAMHPTMMKKRVKIIFSPINGMSKSTTIELLDVHCTYCKYDYSSTSTNPFLIDFDLSPATVVRNNEVLLKRHWAVTDPEMLNVVPAQSKTKNNKPKIIRQYITDRNGVELNEYKTNDKIYYVIESEYMIDKNIDIELLDKDDDFLYEGERLKNDTIKNYTITSNLDQIPLEVIPEDYKD